MYTCVDLLYNIIDKMYMYLFLHISIFFLHFLWLSHHSYCSLQFLFHILILFFYIMHLYFFIEALFRMYMKYIYACRGWKLCEYMSMNWEKLHSTFRYTYMYLYTVNKNNIFVVGMKWKVEKKHECNHCNMTVLWRKITFFFFFWKKVYLCVCTY